MTQMHDVEQHNWASNLNPDYSRAKDLEIALLYGGKNSPGYVHRVLGQHGSPAHAVFDLDDYLACVDEGIDFYDIALQEGDAFDAPSMRAGEYYLGCDLGDARHP